MVGAVFEANIGELEEEVREVFSIRIRKELDGVVQVVYVKKMFLVRF